MPGIDEVEKLPTNQDRLGSPESGTYGEKQALTNLKSALPQSDTPAPPAGGPGQSVSTDPVTPGRGNREGSVPGVPAPLLKPTDRPGVPVDTPLGQGAAPGAVVTGQQRRLQILQILVDSPQTAASTREWAENLIQVLAG